MISDQKFRRYCLSWCAAHGTRAKIGRNKRLYRNSLKTGARRLQMALFRCF